MGSSTGRAALVLKHHHSLMDGIGGMQLAAPSCSTSSAGSSDPGPMPDAPEPEHLSRGAPGDVAHQHPPGQ